MEFGPVTFPANPKASAGVRSLTDTYYEQLRHKDTGAFDAAVRAAGRDLPKEQAIRSLLDGVLTPEEVELALSSLNLTGRPDARSTGGGDAGQSGSNAGVETGQPVAPDASKANEQRHLLLRVKGIVK
jgi:hypothetical protein